MIYGARASAIGQFDVPHTNCENCHQDSGQRITVFGRYAHILWIPIFPVGRKAVAECKFCKRTIRKSEFPPILRELYERNKGVVSRPKWHYLGLGVIGLFFLSTFIFSATSTPDPRSENFKAELKYLMAEPSATEDSISFKMKSIFDVLATEDLKPETFTYHTRVKEDKVLFLMKVPGLHNVEKEERLSVLELIESILAEEPALQGKERYLGIKGSTSWILIKTPTKQQNSSVASSSYLYDFFGPKPE